MRNDEYYMNIALKEAMKAYKEESYIGLWVTGNRVQGSWAHADEKTSYYELQAHVNNIFTRVGLMPQMTVIEHSNSDLFQNALKIMTRGGKVICELGIVNKTIQKNIKYLKKYPLLI